MEEEIENGNKAIEADDISFEDLTDQFNKDMKTLEDEFAKQFEDLY